MRKTDRPLSVPERSTIATALLQAMAWTGVGRVPPTPAQLHALIKQAVDSFRQQSEPDRQRLIEGVAQGLGALWGQVLCDQFGWTWVMIQVDQHDEGFGVVTSIRSHVIYPIRYLSRLLSSPANDQTIEKVFNAIQTNKLPKSLPRGYMVVSGGKSTLLF